MLFFYFFTVFLLLLSIIFIAIFIFIFIDVYYSLKLKLPMLETNASALEKFLFNIDFTNRKVFYDLGSGKGTVISMVARKNPTLQCIGIEYNSGAYFLAKMRNIFLKNKVQYFREDFFNINLKNADIVYIYLYPFLVDQLENKFFKELKKGTIVVANSFPFKNKLPKKVISGQEKKLNTIYIYEY